MVPGDEQAVYYHLRFVDDEQPLEVSGPSSATHLLGTLEKSHNLQSRVPHPLMGIEMTSHQHSQED